MGQLNRFYSCQLSNPISMQANDGVVWIKSTFAGLPSTERPLWSDLNFSFGRRIQPVDATDSLNISAGVWKPSVLRGL